MHSISVFLLLYTVFVLSILYNSTWFQAIWVFAVVVFYLMLFECFCNLRYWLISSNVSIEHIIYDLFHFNGILKIFVKHFFKILCRKYINGHTCLVISNFIVWLVTKVTDQKAFDWLSIFISLIIGEFFLLPPAPTPKQHIFSHPLRNWYNDLFKIRGDGWKGDCFSSLSSRLSHRR